MKITRFFLIAVFYLVSQCAIAQKVDISVTVQQAFSPQARLLKFDGSSFVPVDTSMQISQGGYMFSLDSLHTKGVYRIEIGKNTKFNIVVGNETRIDVNTTVFAPEDSLSSSKSEENSLYWKYQRQKRAYTHQTWLIKSLADFYADTSTFRGVLNNELFRLDSLLFNYAQNLIASSPNLLAAKLIAIEQPPAIKHNSQPSPEELVKMWWKNIDLFNKKIIYTPALQERIWGYLDFFFSVDFDKEQQDLEFIRGVHLLLSQPMDIDIKRHLRQLLVSGFEQSDYADVLNYLHYTAFGKLEPLKKQSVADESTNALKSRVGDTAYNFSFKEHNGNSIDLADVDADYKLVLFWSSWCPHCIEDLPRIKSIYEDYKDRGFEVIAISLDDESAIWEDQIQSLNLSWVNSRIPYAPESDVYSSYDVHETPRMFLLSRDLEIISRPSTVRQLEVRLRRAMRR